MQPKNSLKIAVDAMGGDFAPKEIVKGAARAAREAGVEIALVGPQEAIEKEIDSLNIAEHGLKVFPATEVINNDEQPVKAVMRKSDSSMAVAMKMVKEGKADAMVSAGSTGALMVAALQYLGTLPGVDRPVLGGPFLGLAPQTIVIDLGTNVGCQPYHLLNFAVIGITVAKSYLGIDNPSVGLLNIGTEEGKGDISSKNAFPLLQKSGLNFKGNVEGMDIALGKVNVVVCDGFVGNILVKFTEGLAGLIRDWISSSSKGPATSLDIAANKLCGLLSPTASIGGGPLLGVNGIVCKAHGSSMAAQIFGSIEQAKNFAESGLVGLMRNELNRVQELMQYNQNGS